MDKIAQTERFRLYLVEALPQPLTPMSQHLQIFDAYIDQTRLRIRRIRDPHTKDWSRSLQQRFRTGSDIAKMAEIHLNDAEYALFERLQGPEIRKNRYFHEFDNRIFAFDIYLGKLSGLITAKVELAADEDCFLAPHFAALDLSGDDQFDGERLVNSEWITAQSRIRALLTTSGG
jgi:CYTH domain-containing protein